MRVDESSHSHTVITRQPADMRAVAALSSRARFSANLRCQNAALLAGVVA